VARQDLARLLNALLRELEDGKKGFTHAAEDSEAPLLKPLLLECADDCTRALNALQQSVHSLGEESAKHGSAVGTVRHGWTKLKSAVIADSTLAVLDDVEREHERIEAAFDAVLQVDDLPPSIRTVVQQEGSLVERNLGRLEQARRQYGSGAAS
jgi:uncharacterized protein (TIGR02284 family)